MLKVDGFSRLIMTNNIAQCCVLEDPAPSVGNTDANFDRLFFFISNVNPGSIFQDITLNVLLNELALATHDPQDKVV